MPEMVMLILEVIGTVSFAVSGVIAAVKARFDIFGVISIGVLTALGGGMVRDVLIGRCPPTIFQNFPMFLIAVGTCVIIFVITYIKRRSFDLLKERIEYINNFFDAVGLAAFSVMGTEVAFAAGFSENMFFSVSLGMLTGIGGGIFRDIMTNTTPYVFKKHIYAVATILGSCLYYVLRKTVENVVFPPIVSMAFVVAVRILATKYRWSLPKIELSHPQKGNVIKIELN